jgi:NitT/TauT family transport system substrate-binding protein
MERQARTGYGVAALLLLSGCALLAGGIFKVVPEPERPLLVGTNLWLGYEPFHLARAAGHLPEDVTLVEARSSPALMEAVSAGSLDGAALTMDEVMRLEAAGRPMAVLAVLDISHGADAVLARSPDVTRAPLIGKRIGVEMEGVGAFVLHRFLERQGVLPSQVQVVPVAAGDHQDAFAKHDLDYLVSYEPLVGRLEGQGAVRVFDSAAMAGEVVDVLAVRRDRLSGRDNTLRRLLSAWYHGVGLLKEGSPDAWDRVTRRQGITPEQLARVLSGLEFPDSAGSRDMLVPGTPALEPVRRWLHATGEVAGPVDPLLDPSYLPR